MIEMPLIELSLCEDLLPGERKERKKRLLENLQKREEEQSNAGLLVSF